MRPSMGRLPRETRPSGGRIFDPRFRKPVATREDEGLTVGAQHAAQQPVHETALNDPDIRSIIEAWPALSKPVRAAVRALVEAAVGDGPR